MPSLDLDDPEPEGRLDDRQVSRNRIIRHSRSLSEPGQPAPLLSPQARLSAVREDHDDEQSEPPSIAVEDYEPGRPVSPVRRAESARVSQFAAVDLPPQRRIASSSARQRRLEEEDVVPDTSPSPARHENFDHGVASSSRMGPPSYRTGSVRRKPLGSDSREVTSTTTEEHLDAPSSSRTAPPSYRPLASVAGSVRRR